MSYRLFKENQAEHLLEYSEPSFRVENLDKFLQNVLLKDFFRDLRLS